jgi:hypothetical protein
MAAKRKPLVSGAALHVHKHVYVGDGVRDHRDRDRCRDCGLDVDHRVHQLEPVDPEVAEATGRITGER